MDNEAISLDGVSVMIGMPVGPKVGLPMQTVLSLVSTVEHLARAKVDFGVTAEVTGQVQMGRDAIVADFLATNMQKLLWIDSDMVWQPKDVFRLLALSTKFDVVACAYPAKVDKPTFYVNYEPGEYEANKYGLLSVKGVGLGFTIVDRKVIQELSDRAPKLFDEITQRELSAVFRFDIHEGKRRSEDMAFFADVKALGYDVWLDTMTNLGHIGDKEWTGDIRAALIGENVKDEQKAA